MDDENNNSSIETKAADSSSGSYVPTAGSIPASEVPEQELDCITKEVTSLMEGAADLKVPLLVEAGVGDNWDQAH